MHYTIISWTLWLVILNFRDNKVNSFFFAFEFQTWFYNRTSCILKTSTCFVSFILDKYVSSELACLKYSSFRRTRLMQSQQLSKMAGTGKISQQNSPSSPQTLRIKPNIKNIEDGKRSSQVSNCHKSPLVASLSWKSLLFHNLVKHCNCPDRNGKPSIMLLNTLQKPFDTYLATTKHFLLALYLNPMTVHPSRHCFIADRQSEGRPMTVR